MASRNPLPDKQLRRVTQTHHRRESDYVSRGQLRAIYFSDRRYRICYMANGQWQLQEFRGGPDRSNVNDPWVGIRRVADHKTALDQLYSILRLSQTLSTA